MKKAAETKAEGEAMSEEERAKREGPDAFEAYDEWDEWDEWDGRLVRGEAGEEHLHAVPAGTALRRVGAGVLARRPRDQHSVEHLLRRAFAFALLPHRDYTFTDSHAADGTPFSPGARVGSLSLTCATRLLSMTGSARCLTVCSKQTTRPPRGCTVSWS